MDLTTQIFNTSKVTLRGNIGDIFVYVVNKGLGFIVSM